MQRQENESFSAYRARRAAANLATKNINRLARSGGTVSSRKQLRSDSNPKGTYGANIIRTFARQRATPARLATHQAHVEHIAARKARRAAQSQNDEIARLAA
jgi:hypothetical protein